MSTPQLARAQTAYTFARQTYQPHRGASAAAVARPAVAKLADGVESK